MKIEIARSLKLSRNFTLGELLVSSQHPKLAAAMVPTQDQMVNLITLAATILQPIRDKRMKPVKITSGLRSPELNRAIGGAANSDHMLGLAADIEVANAGEGEDLVRFAFLIGARQAITYPERRFIHVAIPKIGDTRAALLARNIGGKIEKLKLEG